MKACHRTGCQAADQRQSPRFLVGTGWWCTYPSEKYEFVSWDDDIPNIWYGKIIQMFQTTNQNQTHFLFAHHFIFMTSLSLSLSMALSETSVTEGSHRFWKWNPSFLQPLLIISGLSRLEEIVEIKELKRRHRSHGAPLAGHWRGILLRQHGVWEMGGRKRAEHGEFYGSQCEAPKIAKLVYNSNNYGLWYL